MTGQETGVDTKARFSQVLFRWWTLLIAVLLAAGCQREIRLMPTPVVFASGEHSPFALDPKAADTSNRIGIFYATNRMPLGTANNRLYTIVPSQSLHLGQATVRIGRDDQTRETLKALSTTDTESRRPVLRLEALDEMASLRIQASPGAVTPAARNFFSEINQALADSTDKDLTIYVHGVNSSIETAAAQAAQYRHFAGRKPVVLLFAWPSAESGFRYFTDVRHARQSVPAFQHLLELLAQHTHAAHINILAYSAGSQVVSPALARLGPTAPRRSSVPLRLGELYFAAPDLALRTFARQVPNYIAEARRVTVSANLNDAALSLSSWINGLSRVGRPDPTELTEADTRWLIDAAEHFDFDLISVRPEEIPGLSRRSHSFWYDHPWVSSDVVIKLLFHIPPGARGLAHNLSPEGFPFWTFPPDYEQRVVRIMHDLLSVRAKPESDRPVSGRVPPRTPPPAK